MRIATFFAKHHNGRQRQARYDATRCSNRSSLDVLLQLPTRSLFRVRGERPIAAPEEAARARSAPGARRKEQRAGGAYARDLGERGVTAAHR